MKHATKGDDATDILVFKVNTHAQDELHHKHNAQQCIQLAVYETRTRLLNLFNNHGYTFQIGKDFMTDHNLDDNRFQLLMPKLQEAFLDKKKQVPGLYPH